MANNYTTQEPSENDTQVMNLVKSWEDVKNNLYFSVYNRNFHESYLKDAVYEKVEDLALVSKIYVKSTPSGIINLKAKKDMLERWNVSEEEVIQAAKRNTPKMFPAKIYSMDDFIECMVARCGLDPTDIPAELTNCPPMFIVSTNDFCNGASALFYDHVLERLSELLGDTFFIFPSSIYEFIVVPSEDVYSAESMANIVMQTNHDTNAVPTGAILSDHGYICKNGRFSSYVG